MSDSATQTFAVAKVDDLPPGTMKLCHAGARNLCVGRLTDGGVFAIDDMCSHEESSLSEGWLEDDQVECAAHNAVFDARTGAALSLPAVDPVRTYQASIVDGQVVVAVAADGAAPQSR